MPEIIKTLNIQDDTKKYWNIEQIRLFSVQKLTELAETLDIPTIFQDGKRKYMFVYQGMKIMAKR